MFEAITAWAAIATAIGTLLGVYVAYRGIKSQTQSFANSVSADLALKLLHDFDDRATVAGGGRITQTFGTC